MNNNIDLAIVSLCTRLGMTDSTINPLTNIQYNRLATKVSNSSLGSPDNLLEKIDELDNYWEELNLAFEMKDRIKHLLSPQRVVQVHMAIQELKRRNINILTRASKQYPVQLKNKLKDKRPAVLFYIGNLNLLNTDIVGIVGSRNIDKDDEEFIKSSTLDLIKNNKTIISGGARGADEIAENVTLAEDGNLILVLFSQMTKKITDPKIINRIIEGKLLILSESIPNAHFQSFAAMQRNKYIYSLSKHVIVARTDYKKGGTWTGAEEALKNNYTEIVLKDDKSKGFQALLNLGAYTYSDYINKKPSNETIEQLSLFDSNK